jgi:hypothetical protein
MGKYHTRITVPVLLSAKEVRDVLSELCGKCGFCLPGGEIEKLAANPPTDIEEFTAAAMVARAFVAHQESLGTQI